MAPVKKYENKKKGNASRFGILSGTITKQVTKQKTYKKLAVLKPVISPIVQALLQSANSLEVQTEDTFDKLMASYLEKKDKKKNCPVTRSITRSFLNVTSESDENLTLPSVFMPKNLLSSTPLEVKKIDVKDSTSPITRGVMMKTKSPNASNLSIRRSERIARRKNLTISGDWYGSSWSEPHLEITDSSSSLNGGKFQLSETSEQIEKPTQSLNKIDHNLKELAVNITQYNFNNDQRLNVLKKREQTESNNVQNKNKAELDSVIIIEDSSSSLNGGKSKLAKISEQIEKSTESLNKVDHNLKKLAVNITQYNFNNDQRLNVLKKREQTNNVQNKNKAELDSVILIEDSSSNLNGGKSKLAKISEQIEKSTESLNKVDHNLKKLAVNITQYNFNNDQRLNVLKKREQTNNVQNKNKTELDSVILIEDSSSNLNGGKSKLAKISEQIEKSTESLNKVDHNLKELAVNITQYNFNNDQRLNVLKKCEQTNNVQNKNKAELDSVVTIEDSQISNSCDVRYPLMSIENHQSLDKRKSYELTPKPQVSKKLQNNHNEELAHQGLDSIQNFNPLEQRRSDRKSFVAKGNSSGRNQFHSEDNPLFLKPGKEWKRSFLMSKRMSINISCQNFDFGKSSDCVTLKGIVCPCVQCRRRTIVGESILPRRVSVRAVPFSPVVERNLTFLENYAVSINSSYASNSGEQKNGSVFDGYRRLGDDEEEDGFEPPRPDRDKEVEGGFRSVTARDVVLSKCKQSEPLPFEKCYPNSILQHCQKIGEGVFGEVFLFRNPNGGGVTVIKVIPIEGSRTVNGERQKTFEEILSEITIQMELTGLRDGTDNRAGSFSQLLRVTCVRGRYPDRLVELWELFEETHGTENDSPEAFDDDQLYVVFELANGGKDMENYAFSNAKQAFALFKQLACALAVAEVSLEFEHRDLHLGNVLVSVARPRSFVTFRLDGKEIEVPTYGVQLTIIDYTLSRIKHNGVCMYNDLATDPDLFTAEGDYQFEVYRLMRTTNENNWQRFEPYTNILWLHYILGKMLRGLLYRDCKTQVHGTNLEEIEHLYNNILSYKSAKDFVINFLMND